MEDTRCHFCGDAGPGPHMLADCRPDLVEHEIGPTCTWWNSAKPGEANCYAYQSRETNEWTDDHIHFYPNHDMLG